MFASQNLLQNVLLDEKARVALQTQMEVKKEAEELKKQVSSLNSQVSELEDKVKAQPSTLPAQAPAKSMTPFHIGLFVGGLAVGYFIFKVMKK